MFFPLWGLMFAAIGLTMILSPLFAAWAAGRVYYVVTERRAIIFEKVLKLRVRSFSPASVAAYERVSSSGAGGSIIFQRITERGGKGATKVTEIGFIGLSDYASAEQALKNMVARGVA